MPAPNHTCKICGAQYYACNDCDKLRNWRSMCDTPKHYQIYQVLIMYSRDLVSREEAASMLDHLGVTPDTIGNFLPDKIAEIQKILPIAKD